MPLISLKHPEIAGIGLEWNKWRSILQGGDQFLFSFLKKFSDKETDAEFQLRRSLTPIPAFAAAAINDVKNNLFARLSKVTRAGGPDSYQEAIRGKAGGVDLKGNSMNSYLGQHILPELLGMGRVGVFIDRPPLPGMASLRDAREAHPYMYYYRAEEILNWNVRSRGDSVTFDMVLLKETQVTFDDVFGVASGSFDLVRLVERIETPDGPRVMVRFFNTDDVQIDISGKPTSEPIILDLPEIPFVLMEIDSLLRDVANHQIALLNVESSDITYIREANFPFYVEQYNRMAEGSHLKDAGPDGGAKEVETGVKRGRRYGAGNDQPAFIHPSAEPISASMEKQKLLKDDIRMLVNLALSNVRPKFASAESKEFDERGLESGLAAIGLTLEHAESRIGAFWAMYEGGDAPTIKYPERYSLTSAEDRRRDAQQLAELRQKIASPLYRQKLDKQIAMTLLEHEVSDEDMKTILREIESAKYPTSDPDEIAKDHEAGLVSDETASLARGWPEGEAKQAAKDRAERVRLSQSLQQSGVAPQDAEDGIARREEKTESQSADNNPDQKRLVRGEER